MNFGKGGWTALFVKFFFEIKNFILRLVNYISIGVTTILMVAKTKSMESPTQWNCMSYFSKKNIWILHQLWTIQMVFVF